MVVDPVAKKGEGSTEPRTGAEGRSGGESRRKRAADAVIVASVAGVEKGGRGGGGKGPTGAEGRRSGESRRKRAPDDVVVDPFPEGRGRRGRGLSKALNSARTDSASLLASWRAVTVGRGTISSRPEGISGRAR